jgi:formylglycine-generating enzyme required for sulfatase activity
MANHEVTRKQYHDMMGVNAPSSNAVTNVTWLDAVDFCNELSDHEALPLFYLRQGNTVSTQGGVGYRLPTEAEWEYGCRAGTTTFWSLGDNEQQFAEHVDVDGRLPANPFGLFDMHGSVVEWCWDWYGAYDAAEARDPTGPVTGKAHVIRGGTSTGPLVYRRSAIRLKNNPNEAAGPVGFRVVRTFAPTKEAGVNAPNADHAK